MTTPARHRLLRITRYPQYRAPGVRSELALMCAGTDVAIDLLDGLNDILARVQALPYDSFDGEAAAILLRLSGLAQTSALELNRLGRQVTAPELADAPVMERAVAT